MSFDDSAIYAAYCKRTKSSAENYDRSKILMPGGTSRQASFWAPYPLTIDRGQGSRLKDIDGNRYLDLLNNYSALVHGHAYPPIVEAAKSQIGRSTSWAAANEPQTHLAQLLVDRIPSIEQIRFTNSGTEAAALAFTISRIVTGRHKVLMARYGYHGSLLEFEIGSFGKAGNLTYLARYNDLADFEAVLDEHGHEIAAVFLEPVLGAGGIVRGDEPFLRGVLDATHKTGALFVLDEVLSFRFGVSGCQGAMGIEPDLTMLGKIIGGGFPVGAVGGSRELLKIFDQSDLKVVHSGTFNANPLTMVAGEISVSHLTAERIAQMNRLREALQSGLARIAKNNGVPISMNHFESCLNIFFSKSVPESPVAREDELLMNKFHIACLNHGLCIAPRGMIALSTVITEGDISEALDRADAAMLDVAAECG